MLVKNCRTPFIYKKLLNFCWFQLEHKDLQIPSGQQGLKVHAGTGSISLALKQHTDCNGKIIIYSNIDVTHKHLSMLSDVC